MKRHANADLIRAATSFDNLQSNMSRLVDWPGTRPVSRPCQRTGELTVIPHVPTSDKNRDIKNEQRIRRNWALTHSGQGISRSTLFPVNSYLVRRCLSKQSTARKRICTPRERSDRHSVQTHRQRTRHTPHSTRSMLYSNAPLLQIDLFGSCKSELPVGITSTSSDIPTGLHDPELSLLDQR